MKAKELINELINGAFKQQVTCDTIKAGNEEKELEKVAFTMFATVETVKKAKEWGADMLIVHEPTYYDHMDVMIDTPVTNAKKALIEETGMVIYRYHDHMHARIIDQITEGELYYLGFNGNFERTPYSASYTLTLNEPMTALDLAKKLEADLNIKHVRIAGEKNKESSKIAACFGTPGGVFELLCDPNIEIVLTGEACEWKLAVYARDAAALGFNKTLIVMGHIPSERDGMRLLAKRMQEAHKDFESKYIECGEVYSYTEE